MASSNNGKRMSIYADSVTRGMGVGSFQGQEVASGDFNKDRRTGHHHNFEIARVPQNHGGQQSLAYDYREDDEEFGARFPRDRYALNDGGNLYDSNPEINDRNIGGDGASRGNFKLFGSNHHRMEDVEYHNGNAPLTVQAHDNSDGEMEDDEVSLLRQVQNAQPLAQKAKRAKRSSEFNVPFTPIPRLPSRASGAVIEPAYINQVPPVVPTDSISNAALLKRGLNRSDGKVMSKRALGPNDPENILIVNMKESHGRSWKQIADHLNERRIHEGKPPRFTQNSVQNRYNRNAPILFAASGLEFIPVSQRKREKQNLHTRRKTWDETSWDDRADTLLVNITKHVDSLKWAEVAAHFNRISGMEITPKQAAKRMEVI